MRFFSLVIPGLTASTLVLPMLTIAQGHPEMPAQAKTRQEFHDYLDADWKRWMELYPEFATSVGYPGQNRRWTDDSPRGIATRKGQLDESIKKLRAIDRNALPASEQVNHELYRELLGKEEEGIPTQSRVIFLPNSGLKPSLDLAKHGIFTTVVADGLKGKADNYGYEPDGVITVDEMVKYFKTNLPALARKNGKTEEEKGQQPIVLEGHTSDFVLDLNPAITAMSKKRSEAFEKVATNSNLPKEVVEEGRNLLQRMPKLEAQQEMRKAFQKLADGKIEAAQFTKERDAILASTKLSLDAAAQYARHVIGAADTVTQAVAIGLAGCSIEDFTGDSANPIYDIGLATERVAAAAEAAHRDGDFVLTARAENHLHGIADLADTITRLRRYSEAGADVLYAPALSSIDDIRAVVTAVDKLSCQRQLRYGSAAEREESLEDPHRLHLS